MRLKLYRDTRTDVSTIGRLYADDEFLCYTLENHWEDNKPRISCVPADKYFIETKTYGRFYESYKHPIVKLKNVPDRTEILIHIGNYPEDTLGCILVGSTTAKDAVWNSKKTYNDIYPVISQAEMIEIVNCFN